MPAGILTFAFPGLDRVGCAFTTREGGASAPPFDGRNLSFDVGDEPEAVLANREEVRRELGFRHWQETRQVHGTGIAFDPDPALPQDRPATEADGMTTAAPGTALVIKTADCQPILLAHASGRYVAGLHAGWRGNVADFPGIGVRAFCARYGLEPKDVLAVRGPSLGPAAAQFVHFDREFGPDFAPWRDPKRATVDLWALTRHQLERAGLRPENIHAVDRCTAADPAFFSYRRDGRTGRQAGIVWIRETA